MEGIDRELENVLARTRRIALRRQCGGIPAGTGDEPTKVGARHVPGHWPPPMARDIRAAVLELAAGSNEAGEHLCFEDGPAVIVIPLSHERTRIGRSLKADVRFEDPTVSRRHALIVRGPGGPRLIDDGGLNGVFLNGERIRSSPLRHGDEIGIGRHRLLYCAFEQSEPRSPSERSDPACLEKSAAVAGALAYSGR